MHCPSVHIADTVVQCDQTYPACQRCLSRGETCPGVAATADAMFRHQVANPSDKSAAKRSTSKHEPATPASSPSQEITIIPRPDLESKIREHQKPPAAFAGKIDDLVEPPDLPQTLHPSLENVAEFHFFSKIVTSIGWLSYIPDVYSSSPEQSPLRKLVGAASLSVLAKQRKDASLFVTARNANGMALRALHNAIGDQGQYLQDDVLFAVGLCRITCILQGDPGTTARTHSVGLQKLLQQRLRISDSSEPTDAILELIRSAKAELPILLLHNTRDDIALQGDSDDDSFWDCSGICQCEKRIALLCSDVGDVLRKFHSTAQPAHFDVCTTLTQALDLDARLVSWTGGLAPIAWSQHLEHAIRSGLWPSRPGYFSDMQVATFWTHLQAARILLLECIVSMAVELIRQGESYNYAKLDVDGILSKAITTIDVMAYWICFCIPVHLYSVGKEEELMLDSPNGVAGAAGIVWPLQVVLSSVSAKDQYKDQARETLEKLRVEYGIGQARTTLENCHHLGHWSTLP
ncbi:uncharacterized protein MYCFIDRAFT_77762 [Pseudocercospora fijiensis CIRAD86]|uniref:Zn(2)-C6 fungal-type domain-containing protein n=1 Tax=Pseudocercospora fijiensis (strain CIRAD86) TaxID=383855 RepID=M3AR93_PSEFD|nr:uncharacterized protein MYCFIDRAFT_77762 [Pseudocercospora fijiensis CIRAD86]EME79957.1 hypothetical protein MYCFIDRAFT_77762 [Pseudocercospora fijiensis CIRAD86]